MSPALLLIDHGHFQYPISPSWRIYCLSLTCHTYNGVSLGLALASFLAILNSSHILASIFFCLSLNFKQMGLYYSTTIFFYLLGASIDRKNMYVPRSMGKCELTVSLALAVLYVLLKLDWLFCLLLGCAGFPFYPTLIW